MLKKPEIRPGDHVFFTNDPTETSWQRALFDVQKAIDGSPAIHVEIVRDVLSGSDVHTAYSRFDGAGVHVVNLDDARIAVKRIFGSQANAQQWAEAIDATLAACKENGQARYSFWGLARAGVYRVIRWASRDKILPRRILPDDKASYCAELVAEASDQAVKFTFTTAMGQAIDPDIVTPSDEYLSKQTEMIKDFGAYF